MDFKSALLFGIVFVWLAFCFWFGYKDEQERKNRDYAELAITAIKTTYADPKYDRVIVDDALAYVKDHREEIWKIPGISLDVAHELVRASLIRHLTSGRYHKAPGCLSDKGMELYAWYEREREEAGRWSLTKAEELWREQRRVLGGIHSAG